jgi:hypothetical protein
MPGFFSSGVRPGRAAVIAPRSYRLAAAGGEYLGSRPRDRLYSQIPLVYSQITSGTGLAQVWQRLSQMGAKWPYPVQSTIAKNLGTIWLAVELCCRRLARTTEVMRHQ